MNWRIKTPPAKEPVSLEEARLQLRIDHNADDNRIAALIKAARGDCEAFMNKAFITQTIEAFCDDFPEEFVLPRPPLQEVVSIRYSDPDGDEQTIESKDGIYTADTASEPGRVLLAYNQSWPASRGDVNNVIVEYKAGYGNDAEDVPETIRQAILLQVEFLFEHCESKELAEAARALLWKDRR